MTKTIDLLHGRIMRSLCVLALPIVMTYFIQMAYNFIDMIWIGRLGSGAVAGVGVAGMFTWFSNGLVTMAKMGGQVKIGHCLGALDDAEARRDLGAALQLGILFALVFSIGINVLAHSLICFFQLSSPEVIQDAVLYLRITCGLVIFTFMNQIFTASFNVCGDSRTPFIMNTCGLVSNVFADPLLIFGVGPFPALGVAGAAVATVFAQMFVFILFLFAIRKRHPLYHGLQLTKPRPFKYYTQIIRIGLPLSLQDMLFFLLFYAYCTFCGRLRRRCCSSPESRHSGGISVLDGRRWFHGRYQRFYLTKLWCRAIRPRESRLSINYENCFCMGLTLHTAARFPAGTGF